MLSAHEFGPAWGRAAFISLTTAELNAKIGPVPPTVRVYVDDIRKRGVLKLLSFVCPVCGQHEHRVAYAIIGEDNMSASTIHKLRQDEGGWYPPSSDRVWPFFRREGLTLADLSLVPSVLKQHPLVVEGSQHLCRLHCFVQRGRLEMMPDCGISRVG